MKAKELIEILEEHLENDITLSVSNEDKQIFCENIFEVTFQDGKTTIVADITEEYPCPN